MTPPAIIVRGTRRGAPARGARRSLSRLRRPLYCKRGDGTVGLVIGGASGALLGNIIDGGRHRTAGTLIGGAIGALVGKSVAEQQDLRCR